MSEAIVQKEIQNTTKKIDMPHPGGQFRIRQIVKQGGDCVSISASCIAYLPSVALLRRGRSAKGYVRR
jgi:hypothetical protein